jgi:N-acetylglutamate synthase-like GNAT family acetyltransferase
MEYLIRPLGEAEIGQASEILVSTFYDKPFYRYIAPDDAERREFLAVNFDKRLREGFGKSDILAACRGDGLIAGIAVWAPPGGGAGSDAASMEAALTRFSAPLRERFFRFLGILHAARDASVCAPFWSLAPAAVFPSEQGRGAGGALLRWKLREIDGQNLRCFLATQDRENTAIYARFGFKTAREDPLPDSNIIHYTMVREAGAGPRV